MTCVIWSLSSEVKSLSRVRLFVTPWTIAYQAPWSMGFSRQEYWSGLPFPSPGDLPDPGIKPGSPTLQADALPSEPPGSFIPYSHFFFFCFPWSVHKMHNFWKFLFDTLPAIFSRTSSQHLIRFNCKKI